MRKQGGFTLVECMIVITCIVVLAAVTFPVALAAKERARSGTCLRTLAGLHNAMGLYLVDWDDKVPNGRDARQGYGLADHGPVVFDQLMPYVSGQRMAFACPSDRGTYRMPDDYYAIVDHPGSLFKGTGSSYVYHFTGSFPELVPELYLNPPSARPVFFDASGSWHSGRPQAPKSAGILEWSNAGEGYRYNTLFLDGHARSLSEHQWQMSRELYMLDY